MFYFCASILVTAVYCQWGESYSQYSGNTQRQRYEPNNIGSFGGAMQPPQFYNTFPLGYPNQPMQQFRPSQGLDSTYANSNYENSNYANSNFANTNYANNQPRRMPTNPYFPSNTRPVSASSMFSEGTVYSNDERPPLFSRDRNSMPTQRDGQATQQQEGPTRIIPPFLKGLGKEIEDRFYAIVQDPILNGDEKARKIEELMAEGDPEHKKSFDSYQEKVEREMKERQKEVHTAVDGMSEAARIQFQKVSAMMTQPGLADRERLRRIEALYKELPDDVRKEFDTKLAAFGR